MELCAFGGGVVQTCAEAWRESFCKKELGILSTNKNIPAEEMMQRMAYVLWLKELSRKEIHDEWLARGQPEY